MSFIESLKLNKNKEQENKSNNSIFSKELRSVMADIASANVWFNFEEDPDLLESCIYYTESLKARYRHILKKAKAANVTCTPTV